MEAIILAGGAGTRLKSVVANVPKPMADIQGRPFLCYLMEHLACQGVDRALLSVGYRHEVIERYFGMRYAGIEIEYIAEDQPLGTGGAIRKALLSCRNELVAVVNGDTFFAIDMRKMFAFHLQQQADLTVALKAVDNAGRYGSVIMEEGNRITGFMEKESKTAGYINGGIYVLKRDVAVLLQGFGSNFSFEQDFMHKKIGQLSAYAFITDAFFIDIGIPEDYRKAQQTLIENVETGMASC